MSGIDAIGLVYGYGQNEDGTIDEQTRERCIIAFRLYNRNRIHRIFITVSASKNGKLMAEEMGSFFLACGVPSRDLRIDLRGGNTAGETDVCLTLAGTTPVIPISTWYHVPRIWWLWLCRGYITFPRASWKAAHWADLKIEPLKLLNALFRPRRSSKIIHGPK